MAETTGGRRGRLLVFVHVPKTAGTTVRAVLNMNEPGDRSRALGNVFKGGGGIDRALIGRLRNGKGPDLGGVGLVRGHFPLGIREYLPRHLPKNRDLHCFTFLREPADRTLSHYFQIRELRAGSEERGKYALSPLPAEPTLEDALETGYIHDNVHTRMLSGDPEPFGEVTEEMLERARRNLREELVFFGLTERFDESLVLAKYRLGLRGLLYRSRDRVNSERPRGDEVPKDLREAAERCNRYDIELYRYARELFEGAPELREIEFEVELAALRAARADGEIDLTAPAPERFDGSDDAWRMLLHARAMSQRLERKLAGSGFRAAGDRARARELKQELDRRDAVPARMEELEREVEQLRSASSRAEELEKEVERLEAAAGSRPKRNAGRGSPRTARSRSKRGSKPRDSRTRNSKRGGTTRARPRAGRRTSSRGGDGG